MDEATVRHVATLARLKLDDDEIARLAGELSKITEYIDQLGQLDLKKVEPTVHPAAELNVYRDDESQESLKRETAVENAPDSEQGFFRVPPVIE
jgi:aspartyl-tRNA(Asn)/glutamyl-tRNA(Gln) amidotransferase subunit C